MDGLDVSLEEVSSSRSVIRAAAAQMVFASRSSQDFISPEQVNEVEKWSGRGVLEALSKFDIPPEVRLSMFPWACKVHIRVP